jgi:hypothetical protein
MAKPHPITLALDLARLPAAAHGWAAPPIPSRIVEIIRVAAAAPQSCNEAVAASGAPMPVVIEAARFYLQHVLFRPDADCYRVLGLRPGASRATARNHMRLLMQWLHPDRNGELEAVYAARVLRAWREISSGQPSAGGIGADKKHGRRAAPFRMPWIALPARRRPSGLGRSLVAVTLWALPAGLMLAFLALWAALYYFGPEQTAAMISVR